MGKQVCTRGGCEVGMPRTITSHLQRKSAESRILYAVYCNGGNFKSFTSFCRGLKSNLMDGGDLSFPHTSASFIHLHLLLSSCLLETSPAHAEVIYSTHQSSLWVAQFSAKLFRVSMTLCHSESGVCEVIGQWLCSPRRQRSAGACTPAASSGPWGPLPVH